MADRLLSASTGHALSPEDARWARAWLVSSQATVSIEPRLGTAEGSSLTFDAGQVLPPKGLGDSLRRARVLAALLAARVLRPAADSGGSGDPARVCWTAEVCAVHSAAVTLDWPNVVALCEYEPAALLVVRTLAEYVVPAHDWTVVPRRDLTERTGYMQKQVRVALRRLEAAGLIESEGESGRTARYRFAARALAPRWEQPRLAGPSLVTPAALAAAGGMPERGMPEHGAEQGIDLVIGGVTVHMAPGASLDVGAGARAHVEVAADGRLSLRVAAQ